MSQALSGGSRITVTRKGFDMLFAVQWVPRGEASEEQEKRLLARFTKWQPPEGVEFQGFYDYADGDCGLAIAESSSAEALLEAIAPWTGLMRFSMRPLVPTEKSVPIIEKAYAWRDSIG